MKQIILNGFMGTGKSTLGKSLAQKLDCPFFDLDQLIEKDAQLSVDQIFETFGEDYFRSLESKLLSSLLKMEGVIALGGGTLLNELNRNRVLDSSALLIGLTASVDQIVSRVSNSETVRPLVKIDKAELKRHVQNMLCLRSSIYQFFDFQFDTTDLTVETISNQIVALTKLELSRVTYPGGLYPIVLGRNMLSKIGALISYRLKPNKIVIVTNPIVSAFYLEPVKASIQEQEINTEVIHIPDGEDGKHLDTVNYIYEALAAVHADRNSLLLALGGGVTGDITGFAAATYMRGIPFVQVPTTLLSMVDSSIGGKTGVNLSFGKNLVGAFHQPELVLMDFDTLITLPQKEIINGFGEFLKHGFIQSNELIQEILHSPLTLKELIQDGEFGKIFKRSLDVKRLLVQIDPYEKHERMALNFGHTLGHAIEKTSGYQISHGEAVLMGMWFAANLSARMGFLSSPDLAAIRHIYEKYHLPMAFEKFNRADLISNISHDKKKDGENFRWILLQQLGEAFVQTFSSTQEIDDLLGQMGVTK